MKRLNQIDIPSDLNRIVRTTSRSYRYDEDAELDIVYNSVLDGRHYKEHYLMDENYLIDYWGEIIGKTVRR